MYCMDANEMYREKAWRQLCKNAVSCIEQFLDATPHKAAAVRPPNTHHENYPSETKPDMWDIAGEVKTNS